MCAQYISVLFVAGFKMGCVMCAEAYPGGWIGSLATLLHQFFQYGRYPLFINQPPPLHQNAWFTSSHICSHSVSHLPCKFSRSAPELHALKSSPSSNKLLTLPIMDFLSNFFHCEMSYFNSCSQNGTMSCSNMSGSYIIYSWRDVPHVIVLIFWLLTSQMELQQQCSY